MRSLLHALGFLGLALPTLAQGERPNILFIFTDDHASHAISAYGSEINETPNLDRLANEGMLFRNAFCTNSICGPSRAVVLTGKHSHLNGVIRNGVAFDGSQPTAPKYLQAAGYETAVVGKWHLRSDPTGFDFWKVLIGQGPYYNPTLNTPEGREEHIGYTTDVITDITLDWLKGGRDEEKPFFLMYQHKAPHRNWQPGPAHLTMYDDVTIPEPHDLFDDWEGRTSAAGLQSMTVERHLNDNDLKLVPPRNLTEEQLAAWNAAYEPKNAAFREAGLTGDDLVRWKYQRYIKDYLRCIASVDDGVGRVLDWLDESGLAENTIVIYSSDQGFYLGDHGWYDKRWMYEESLRMPLLVRWPGAIRAGSVNEDLVQNLDFAQTFLEIAGASQPDDMQGRSLVPLLRGQRPDDWRDSIYYHYLEFPGAHDVRRHYGVRTQRYKLIRYYTIDEWELFDLEEDPHELRSVHDDPEYAEIRGVLEAELKRLQDHYLDTDPEAPWSKIDARKLRKQAERVELELVLQLEEPGDEVRKDLDPSARPIAAGAWCTPSGEDGVIVAQGGGSHGYSLYLMEGRACFAVRAGGSLAVVRSPEPLAVGEAVHVVGTVDATGRLRILLGGREVASAEGHLLGSRPGEELSVRRDSGSSVGDYSAPFAFEGEVRDLRLYWGPLDDATMTDWAER